MKTISKIKLALGSIAAMPIVLILTIGLAAPAVAPSKADALTVIAHQRMATLKAYENADSLSDKDLVKLLGAVGFEGKHLKEAWAVAKKESHGNPLNHNGNRKTGDNSYGLFQVNMLGQMGNDRRAQFGLASNAELLNPVKNAQVAFHMSNGGKNWSAWKGVHTSVVKYWMSKYPDKATTTQAHKAKAKAVAKHKAKAKPKQKQ